LTDIFFPQHTQQVYLTTHAFPRNLS